MSRTKPVSLLTTRNLSSSKFLKIVWLEFKVAAREQNQTYIIMIKTRADAVRSAVRPGFLYQNLYFSSAFLCLYLRLSRRIRRLYRDPFKYHISPTLGLIFVPGEGPVITKDDRAGTIFVLRLLTLDFSVLVISNN